MTDITTTAPATLAEKLHSVESTVALLFDKFDKFTTMLEPVISLIPGAAPAAAIIKTVDAIGERIEGDLNGMAQTDNALLSVGLTQFSTGNAQLDARLAAIESFIEKLGPFLALIGKELGLDSELPKSEVQSVGTVVAGAAQSSGV